jgi:PadR family transcriptional regulator PadR
MREPTFWILTALVDQVRHGYGVMREVESLTDGQVKLQAGTLYAALDRLTVEGLVEVDRQENLNGHLRRYYRLTDEGAVVLTEETARLAHKTSTAMKRLIERQFGAALGTAQVTFG